MTDLTDKWNKGELPEGDYYIERRNGYIPYDNIDSKGVWRNSIDEDIIEVLAPVPSYEEWKFAQEQLHKEGTWYTERAYKNVRKAVRELAKKLLQVKPELREWLEVNFKEYL